MKLIKKETWPHNLRKKKPLFSLICGILREMSCVQFHMYKCEHIHRPVQYHMKSREQERLIYGTRKKLNPDDGGELWKRLES